MSWNILGWGLDPKVELEGMERGETVIGMYCMRDESIINKNINNQRVKVPPILIQLIMPYHSE